MIPQAFAFISTSNDACIRVLQGRWVFEKTESRNNWLNGNGRSTLCVAAE